MQWTWKKKTPTKAMEYSDVEQGVPKEQPKQVDKLDIIIQNQQVIAENQRVTFEALQKLAAFLMQFELGEAAGEKPMKTTKVTKK